MKRIVFLLALVVPAGVAIGEVTIVAEDLGGGVAAINYVSDVNISGFDLIIEVDGAEIIEVEAGPADGGDGNLPDYVILAVAEGNDAGIFGSNSVAVELSASDTCGDGPGLEGTICTVGVDWKCTLSVLPGSTATLEDGNTVAPNLAGATDVLIGCRCLGDAADTGGLGPPDSRVNIGDLNAMVMAMFVVYPTGDPTGMYTLYPIPPGLECVNLCDTSGFGPPDDRIDIGDFSPLLMAMFVVYPSGDPNGLYEVPCL